MGEEAEELLRHRFEIVNVWRPIRGPLRDAPLAVGRLNPAEDRFRNQPLPFRLGRANWSSCPIPGP
jgi:hypothetical protein